MAGVVKVEIKTADAVRELISCVEMNVYPVSLESRRDLGVGGGQEPLFSGGEDAVFSATNERLGAPAASTPPVTMAALFGGEVTALQVAR